VKLDASHWESMGAEQSDLLAFCSQPREEAPRRRVHKFELTQSTVDREVRIRQDVFEKGATKLHIAAATGDELLVRKLVTNDRSLINATDDEGRTPFYMACK